MKLRSIVVRNFRKLRGAHRVHGLSSGLNVIAGDNEEGKSTLLAALRAAVFERHRLSGQLASSFQPFGSVARPEIEIDFEIGEEEFHLTKAFCQRPEAELRTPTGVFTGSSAEDQLLTLLGVHVPGRSSSRPDDHGAYGILWVEQGFSIARPDPGARARGALSAIIETEIGDVLGGPRGTTMLRLVEERKEALLGKRGKPRGGFQKRLENVEWIRRDLDARRALGAEYDARLAELSRHEEELHRLRDEHALKNAEAAFHAAEAMLATLNRRRREATEAIQAHELAIAQHAEAATILVGRMQKLLDLGRARATIDALTQELSDARRPLSSLERDLESIRFECDRLYAEREAKAGRREHAERTFELTQVDAAMAALEQQLASAEASEAVVQHAARRLAQLPASPEAIAMIQEKVERERNVRASLEEALASLRLNIDPRFAVTLNGEPIEGNSELSLSTPTELAIAGVGTISIAPQPISIEDRRAAYRLAKEEAEDALREFGIDSLDELYALRSKYLTELEHHRSILDRVAPAGIAALRGEVSRTRHRVAELRTEMPAETQLVLHLGEAIETPNCEVAGAELRRASAAYKRVAREHDAVVATRDEAARALEACRERLGRLEGEHGAIQANLSELETQLERARTEMSDDDLRHRVAHLERMRELAAASRVAAERSLGDLDAKSITEQANSASTHFEATAARVSGLERLSDRARDWLEGRGHLGIGEEIARLEGELEHARTLAEHDEREAAALTLLGRVLNEAAANAKGSCANAIEQRVQTYVRELLPESTIRIDGELRVDALVRRGVPEPFESLSYGTREQIAILTRLAFADLLGRDGGRPPLLLDDVLAYSDPRRLERMQAILKTAAETTQILVFTCRPAEWDSIADRMLRIDSDEPAPATPTKAKRRAAISRPTK